MKCMICLLTLLPLRNCAQSDPGIPVIPWAFLTNRNDRMTYPGSSSSPAMLAFQHNRSFMLRMENRFGMKDLNGLEMGLQFHGHGGQWLLSGMMHGNTHINSFQGTVSHALKLNEQLGMGLSLGFQGNYMRGYKLVYSPVIHAGILYWPKPELAVAMHYGKVMNVHTMKQSISYHFNSQLSAAVVVMKISSRNPVLSALMQWRAVEPWTFLGGFDGIGKQPSLGIGKTSSSLYYGFMLSQHPMLGFSCNLVYGKAF